MLSNIPLVLKIIYTLFIALIIPIYWRNYGLQNFLWFSDIGLFLTFGALWLESPLLISIAVLAILPFEIGWDIDFLVQLFTGHNMLGIAHYMFESKYTFFLRALSLFHIFIQAIWIWYLLKWGYAQQAIYYAPILVCTVLVCTYLFTDPAKNINGVFMPQALHWDWMHPLVWLTILIVGSWAIMLCMHGILKKFL